ncbi:MAG: FtsX-like permease family protein [Nocardioidaceae bacterium]
MAGLWLRGLLSRRWGRLAASAAGIALAVALLASLGTFLAASKATMTQRSADSIAVDWQVEVQREGNPANILAAVRRAPGTIKALPVGFADTPGFRATAGGTTQATGAGKVLGIPAGYQRTFPLAIRLLTGSSHGALVAQQTAANLHVAPGDTVTIARVGMPVVSVRVSGVVELPQADSLFQVVGAPPQSQLQAPPDNVLLLPAHTFASDFATLAKTRPDLVKTQVHVQRSHLLPADPSAAYTVVTSAAKNFEATVSGAALVGDNLGTVLGSAREDSLYSQILFLFLGTPGALLAAALTAAVAGAGATRRRREQALLRTRGSSRAQLLRVVVIEAALIGLIGAAAGLGIAALIGRLMFGSPMFGASTPSALVWAGVSVLVGLLVAGTTIVLPARRDLREATTMQGRGTAGRQRSPRWMRFGLDFVLLAASLAIFYATSRSKYSLVLAPEGVPTISVNYWAFLGPGLLWVSCALLTWRLADLVLDRGRVVMTRVLRPAAGNLSATVTSTMYRQRRVIIRSAVLVGLAISFAMSTATFNSTYRQQAEIDAQLTNGADVTVTESPGVVVPPSQAARFTEVSGVQAVSSLQHRFAYVGADLQDLFGIDTGSITQAVHLQDAYFQGASAAQVLSRLRKRPDGILVSAETVNDFQLSLGDRLRLRLQNGQTQRFRYVTFHYVGIVNEFPTAPKDSFLVANASYVAQQTGSDAVGSFLVNTGGQNTGQVAQQIQQLVGTSAQVTDVQTSRTLVGSSLTSVDLSGLTRVELAFALALVAAAGGLVTALGLNERRRTLAIATALGATARQLRGFTIGESAFVMLGGMFAGGLAGWGLSEMLVKVLTGVFDPPPAHLAFPWAYLVLVAACSVVAIAAAAVFTSYQARQRVYEQLREL